MPEPDKVTLREVYLIRHATEKKDNLNGFTDDSLQKLILLADFIASRNPRGIGIVSSPLDRAYKTAERLNKALIERKCEFPEIPGTIPEEEPYAGHSYGRSPLPHFGLCDSLDIRSFAIPTIGKFPQIVQWYRENIWPDLRRDEDELERRCSEFMAYCKQKGANEDFLKQLEKHLSPLQDIRREKAEEKVVEHLRQYCNRQKRLEPVEKIITALGSTLDCLILITHLEFTAALPENFKKQRGFNLTNYSQEPVEGALINLQERTIKGIRTPIPKPIYELT